ncbi:MAG: DedA family protein [Bacteroidetes bacterium]|nr:MAG: DedA family protein [Bacteroidota bacterium]
MFDAFLQFLQNPLPFIEWGGLALVTLIVFAETGLFFCFFLPGDYLLFTAGLLCSTNIIKEPIWFVVLCIVVAAIIGNYVGYFFGKSVGKGIYNKKESWFFKRKHIESTEEFFNKYGGQALIMARFLPIMRTFTPIVAGIIRMEMGKFSWFVVIGAIAWGTSITLAGFFLGKIFPEIIHYLHYIIIFFVAVTSVVAIQSYRKMNKAK